jgi:TatD DNase family protein
MFSDTHFHFRNMTENRGVDGVAVLTSMAERACRFGLDIGTEADDLLRREQCVEKAITSMEFGAAQKAREFVYFSAGIWPSVDEIHARAERIEVLKAQIEAAAADENQDTLNRKIVALGEFGLDHHWNPSGVDGRCESDFDDKTYFGEQELFEMQLNLAHEMKLPSIIHSRDAFEDTLACIKRVGNHDGIIHCYSYGLDEAKKFLDLGWYISFSGSITYTKKSKMDAMLELLRYVPEDRILCETDSPYLAPVPHRGEPCSPVLVEHTYKFAADARGVSVEELSETVDKNIRNLFFNR